MSEKTLCEVKPAGKFHINVCWRIVDTETNEVSFFRKVFDPSSDWSNEDDAVQLLCDTMFSADVLQEYKELIASINS